MSDDRADLRRHLDALMETGLGWMRGLRRLPVWFAGANTVAVVALGMGSGMSGDLVPSSGTGVLTAKGLVIFGAAAVALVSNLLGFVIRDRGTALLARAAALQSEAQRHLDGRDTLHARLDGLAQLDLKRLALIDANRSLREALENALLIPAADVSGSAQAMLDAARRFILASVGFGIDEQWAISVFQVRDDRLVRIAAIRADALPPAQPARSWGKHEGFVGEAWGRGREMIIADSREPGTAEAYPVPLDLQRAYDADRYRSMAAIPVRLGPSEIWGVVAASTNCHGRFRRDPGNKQVQAVDTVRLIARMTGLTAAAFRRSGQ